LGKEIKINISMKRLYEQDMIGDKQYAQELLNVQSWYNGEIKRLNDTLAKKRSDALTKYQDRAKIAAAEKKPEATTQKPTNSNTEKQTGTVTTAGQPVNTSGNPPAQTVESYPDILKIKSKSINELDYRDHDMRNWYEKPENKVGYEEPKIARKKKMTSKDKQKLEDLKDQITDLTQDIRFKREKFESPSYEGAEGEIEQFFAEIGPEASEILNSGGYESDEEKAAALALIGIKNPEALLQDYYYYYPEFNSRTKGEREENEQEIKDIENQIQKLQNQVDEIESMNESTFTTTNADPYEIQDLKDYLDAENISYFEEEGGGVIDFDETELDKEWQDRISDMGLEEDVPTDDILTVDDDNDEESDEEDIIVQDEKIDEDKVFYVKITDADGDFTGKIYKLFDEGDWRAKIVDGESDTFEKLNYDPSWDEFDIIAFLRENYDDAELVSEDEFNDTVEETDVTPKEDVEESANHKIPTLDQFINEKEEN